MSEAPKIAGPGSGSGAGNWSGLGVMGLTEEMRDCVLVLHELTLKGRPPSYEELVEELDLSSKSQVHRLVTALRERGWVEFTPAHARSMRLLHTPPPHWFPEDPELQALLRGAS